MSPPPVNARPRPREPETPPVANRRGDGALNPVRSSAAIREAYQARLEREVDAMHRSIRYWLLAQWRANTPDTRRAQDASPVRELQKLLRQRGRLWRGKFREAAERLAQEMTSKTGRHVDRAIEAMLRDNGMAVRFRLSQPMRQVVQASLNGQVSLITDLADEHLKRVEGYVMRAIQSGQDLQQLTENLEDGLGIAKRRAAFIARHQTSIATATMARTRAQELGCEEAFWLHSAGGQKPRPDHVAFSGKKYSLDKGVWLEEKWTHPGVEPNCRCVSRPILPGLGAN